VIAPNVHVELVHDPHRHRAVIGWSADPALLRVTAEQLIAEADRRAQQFEGIDDVTCAEARAEVDRLRRVLELILPDERVFPHEQEEEESR
jgi:hypothetical protein